MGISHLSNSHIREEEKEITNGKKGNRFYQSFLVVREDINKKEKRI